jgi:hypothetical protein
MQHRSIHSGDLVKAVMNPSHAHRKLIGMMGIVVNVEFDRRRVYFSVLWSDGSLHMHKARNLMVLS